MQGWAGWTQIRNRGHSIAGPTDRARIWQQVEKRTTSTEVINPPHTFQGDRCSRHQGCLDSPIAILANPHDTAGLGGRDAIAPFGERKSRRGQGTGRKKNKNKPKHIYSARGGAGLREDSMKEAKRCLFPTIRTAAH